MRDVREVLAEALRGGDAAALAELTPEQALDAVEVLAGLLAVARAGLAERARGSGSPARVEVGTGQGAADRQLTAQEVAEVLRCSVAQVYRQAKEWKFAHKLGHRTLRVSEVGLRAWLARQSRR